MYGTNPIRSPVSGDGSMLQVQHIFPTLQGEGPYAGVPAIFVRLGGCNLACGFCDTEFETFTAMPLEAIVARVRRLASKGFSLPLSSPTPLAEEGREGGQAGKDGATGLPPTLTLPRKGGGDIITLAVITGGEPLRQPIAPLCAALVTAGFKIQIETNGTLWRDLPEGVEIVCSPKNNGSGYFPLRPDLLARVNAFKFLVSAQRTGYADVPDFGKGNILVFVQPMDEYDDTKNTANLMLARELAHRHGYRLSVQLHKMLGIE